MDAMQALKQAANISHTPITHIGLAMGKTAQYVTSITTRNSTPKADTLARMLNVCGYSLYAIPDNETVPDTAIKIDTGE